MVKQVTCPVCNLKWEGMERCPCDGWELGEKWVLTPDPEAYERKYRERLERAREAMAQFKAGALGSGEEGLQQLRERLKDLGLDPGLELEKWAGQNLPGPFGGDCCLAITTSEEAEVFIDGHLVGTTRNRYLLVEHLKAGKHRVEAKARYGYGVVEVELAAEDVQQCQIKLQRGQGFLRVLSEVGVLTLKVDGKSYRVPARIEVEAGRKLLTVREGNLLYEAEVEVLPGQTVEVRVTPEWLQDCVRVLKGHTNSVYFVDFSPDGRLLASGSWDCTIRLWRVSDGKCLVTVEAFPFVYPVAFSPDGRLSASCGSNATIRLWRASDGKCFATLEGHTSVHTVAFSLDGQLLASGSENGTIRLWRVSDGKCLATLKGHTDWVCSVAFSPDGQLLASGSDDNTIRLWRVSDFECIAILKGHEVDSVAFSPDGRLLASGKSKSDDKTIRLWTVKHDV